MRRLTLILVSICIVSCNQFAEKESKKNHADSAYINGKIYTVNQAYPWAEALAVKGGKFLKVGTNNDIAAFIGPGTEVTDLNGGFIMPGIHDLHVHPMEIGRQVVLECNIPSSADLNLFIAKVKACGNNLAEGKWLRGGQWSFEFLFSDTPPNKQLLDEAVPDNPVFLFDSTLHGGWLNSRAMQELGITRETPDPMGGEILREPGTGEPTGILYDKATYNMMRLLPRYTSDEYEDALLWSVRQFNKHGITGIKDALAEIDTVKAYASLENKNQLSLRVAASLPWKSSWSDDHSIEQASIQNRTEYVSKRINTNFVKLFLDGIPIFNSAGIIGEHNQPAPEELNYGNDELVNDLMKFDKQGITVKMHASGPGAVRQALNAIEKVRAINGKSALRHEITHIGATLPDDIPRFKALNVTAELAPVLLLATDIYEGAVLRSFHQSGANIVFGSDWPAIAPDANPWPGIEVMLTGLDPHDSSSRPAPAEQLISLTETIEIITKNGASALNINDHSGMIVEGGFADFIILDRNLFEIPVHEISETEVVKTIFAGKPVYQSQ